MLCHDYITLRAMLGQVPRNSVVLVTSTFRGIDDSSFPVMAKCVLDRGVFEASERVVYRYEIVPYDDKYALDWCICNGKMHQCGQPYPEA